MPPSLANLLEQLEEQKRAFAAKDVAKTVKLLAALASRRFTDAESLIRFHESLLFMRAYPQAKRVLARVEKILKAFRERVEYLRETGADISYFDYGEVSGIVGTSFPAGFSYPVARWLALSHASKAKLDWEGYEGDARLGETLPRFLPLLEDDALVEANVPFLRWLRAAEGNSKQDLAWLVERFERSHLSEREKAEAYDSLSLWIRLSCASYRFSRTGMRSPARKIFYHTGPLIARRDISLVKELKSAPLPIKKLRRAEGEAALEMTRAASAVRYRELYGFTHGDARRVVKANLGRGVEIFVFGVPPRVRLPLRAYHAGFILKNSVPVGYVEGISLFEKMEIGFNLYYTFRDGETAWLYARVMRLFRQLAGVTAFSIDPYQIGFENEEGIESGAFWFYRKLGFRTTRAELAKMTESEEKKILARKGYRTTARTLRRLAAGHMIFELSETARGSWDNFQVRNLGLAVQRRMASDFGGDALRIRRASVENVERALKVRTARWKEDEKLAFENLSLVLSLIPELESWAKEEKQAVVRIIRAKAGAQESLYLRLQQKHPKLREAIIKLGS
ncbi:MAG: hypothetical protein WCB68_22810 [Pyrinomonadaceae bacterium]